MNRFEFLNIGRIILRFICTPWMMWKQVEAEQKEATTIQLEFYYPLLAFVTVAAFCGAWFSVDDFVFAVCLKKSVLTLSAFLAGYFLSILTLIEIFARLWNIERNYDLFVRFVTYSSSLMLAIKSIVSLFSSFFFLLLANVYAAFIIWEGFSVLFPVFEDELKKQKVKATFIVFAAIYIYPNLFEGCLNYLMK